jgi:hypothetical protein
MGITEDIQWEERQFPTNYPTYSTISIAHSLANIAFCKKIF